MKEETWRGIGGVEISSPPPRQRIAPPPADEPARSMPYSRQRSSMWASISSTPLRVRGDLSCLNTRGRVAAFTDASPPSPYFGYDGGPTSAPGARPDQPDRGRHRGQRASGLRVDRSRSGR